jgi:hypothetical protein
VRNEKKNSKSILLFTTTFGGRRWVGIFLVPHNSGTKKILTHLTQCLLLMLLGLLFLLLATEPVPKLRKG